MRRHPRRAPVNPRNPKAWGTSDRNGMVGTHARMQFQHQWAGFELINTKVLVHPDELDIPQRQLGAFVIPPDPVPIMNARPEQYSIDEEPVSTRYTIDGRIRVISGNNPYPVERIISVRGNL